MSAIKRAKRQLKQMGITPEVYPTKRVAVGHKSLPVIEPSGNRLTHVTDDLSRLVFKNVPVYEYINPYKRLLKAFLDGTYTDELKQEIDKVYFGK